MVGLLVGLAIYNGIILDVTFPMALYRKLYGQKLTVNDLKDSFPVRIESCFVIVLTTLFITDKIFAFFNFMTGNLAELDQFVTI